MKELANDRCHRFLAREAQPVARAVALQQSLWGLGRRAAGSLSGRDPFRQVRPLGKLAPDERPAATTPPCGTIWVRSPASFRSVLAQILALSVVPRFPEFPG